jgi:hypothetical protein
MLVRPVQQHDLLATKIPVVCLMFAALLILSSCCMSGDSGELDRMCYCNSVPDTKIKAV